MIELIIVIAIIAILAGIMSLAIGGFQRDARIETNNNKAQMIYMAFQDILIDCEVKQDKSIFEGHSGEDIDGIVGAVVFFRISEKMQTIMLTRTELQVLAMKYTLWRCMQVLLLTEVLAVVLIYVLEVFGLAVLIIPMQTLVLVRMIQL